MDGVLAFREIFEKGLDRRKMDGWLVEKSCKRSIDSGKNLEFSDFCSLTSSRLVFSI